MPLILKFPLQTSLTSLWDTWTMKLFSSHLYCAVSMNMGSVDKVKIMKFITQECKGKTLFKGYLSGLVILFSLFIIKKVLWPSYEYDNPGRTPKWTGMPHRIPHYLMQPACEVGKLSGLLIYCYTKPFNFKERLRIRALFQEHYEPKKHGNVSLIFVIGVSNDRPAAKNSPKSNSISVKS